MIYWKQSLDIQPASPATRDRVIEAVEEMLPASAQAGARLAGAWFAHEEWYTQVIHVTEFDDLAAVDAWRAAARADEKLRKGLARLGELAPERRDEILEPLGAVAPEALHEAIAASRDDPQDVYTFAILEVVPGQMEQFTSMLGAAAPKLPIIASWTDLAGNPNRVIDLWKGDLGREGYRPSTDAENAFFEPLRRVAPRERMMRLHPLPYSPLR